MDRYIVEFEKLNKLDLLKPNKISSNHDNVFCMLYFRVIFQKVEKLKLQYGDN